MFEDGGRLELRCPMRASLRLVFMLLGFVPLLAPYELLLRPDWQGYWHPFFVLSALIAAGAVALSLLLFFAAAAGISSTLVFDRAAATLTYSYEAPVVRRASRVLPLAAVGRIEVGTREWSDGAPSYHLRVAVDGAEAIEFCTSWSRGDVEAIRARVEAFVAGRGGGVSRRAPVPARP